MCTLWPCVLCDPVYTSNLLEPSCGSLVFTMTLWTLWPCVHYRNLLEPSCGSLVYTMTLCTLWPCVHYRNLLEPSCGSLVRSLADYPLAAYLPLSGSSSNKNIISYFAFKFFILKIKYLQTLKKLGHPFLDKTDLGIAWIFLRQGANGRGSLQHSVISGTAALSPTISLLTTRTVPIP